MKLTKESCQSAIDDVALFWGGNAQAKRRVLVFLMKVQGLLTTGDDVAKRHAAELADARAEVEKLRKSKAARSGSVQ